MAGLTIIADKRPREEKMADEFYELDQEWWLTADKSAIVLPGPEGKFVLGGKGSKIPMADAIKYGLVGAVAPNEQAIAEPVPDEPQPKPKKAKPVPAEAE